MPFGPNAINPGYGQTQNTQTGLSNEVIASNPAQTPGNFVITGGSIDGTPIGITTPSAAHFTTIDLNTPLAVADGGTGISSTPTNGKLLIGNGAGFSLNNLTAGAGMLITNGSGTITLATTGGSGTVTSVDVSGGTTGLTYSGGPITSSGTITMAGTLEIANGGTGATSDAAARSNLGVTATGADTTYAYRANNLSDLGSAATARTNLGLGGLAVANTVNLATTATGGVTGILPILNGGTSASTATDARAALSAAVLGTNNDITSMTGITGGIATVDYIDFDTAATPSTVAGRLWWDNSDGSGTLNIGMKGGAVVQQVGEELFYRLKASAAITLGQVVMIDGAVGTSGQIKGKPATGLSINDGTKILGVASESVSLNNWCIVSSYGFVRGIDTTGGVESWAVGDVLYYNPAVAGGLTKVIPTAPNLRVEIASVVIVDASNGEILVKVHPGSVLGGTDANVQFTTLTDNNFIAYSSSNSRWENLTPSAARTAMGVSSTGSDTTYAFRANNLSDLASAVTARTNLGLAIGTNVQAYSAQLDSVAALATNGMVARTAANTVVARTITGTSAEVTVTNGDGVSGNPTLSLPTALTFTGKTVTGGTFASPTLTTPALGTPSSGTLTSCTGLPVSSGISGLGTGVATALAVNVGSSGAFVVNGGALGTPSSGTVTNLTGTASININGTVGATTPNTVAGTTGSFSGAFGIGGVSPSTDAKLQVQGGNATTGIIARLTANSSGANSKVHYTDGFTYNWTAGCTGDAFTISRGEYQVTAGTVVGTFTSTGLNSTAIGATTPSTGAFTTLSATSNSWIGASGGALRTINLDINGVGTNDSVSLGLRKKGTGYSTIRMSTVGDASGWDINYNYPASNDLSFYSIHGGATVGTFTSTGLAVTGTLSASGNITSTTGAIYANGSSGLGSATYASNARNPIFHFGNATDYGISYFQGTSGLGSTDSIGFHFGTATAAGSSVNINSTGLAVTGTLSCTTGAELATSGGGNFVKVGSATAIGSGTGIIEVTFNNAYYGMRAKSSNSGGGSVLQILKSTGAEVGLISHNDTATTYSTSSDYRLKDITGPLTNSGTFIDALKPKVGTWKADGSKFVGFIAHEFAEVSPSSVVGEKDAVDESGNPKYQSMQASSSEVIANLVAELQSVRARLAAAGIA